MIGSRLGPYEITAKLGEGGMEEVHRATDTRLMAAAVELRPDEVVARAAESLFDVMEYPADSIRGTYGVAPDARFPLLGRMDEDDVAMRVVTHWRPAALR